MFFLPRVSHATTSFLHILIIIFIFVALLWLLFLSYLLVAVFLVVFAVFRIFCYFFGRHSSAKRSLAIGDCATGL